MATNFGNRRYAKKAMPRPQIDPKCWTEEDLEFWMTGDYDMSRESPDVQNMLELASMLNDARVEWLMDATRRECHENRGVERIREPRHAQSNGAFRRGYGRIGD